jgi:type I restriction enzyme S subunit
MNAEGLLAHYERIAEAPDAVARLRRFILDLAVRGKLVPQDSKDEPAPELLKRIANEKVRLAKAGLIRVQKLTPPPSEAPFSIPASWRWSQLAEVGILSPRNEAPDTMQASFVPMPLIAAEYGVANRHEIRLWGEIKKGYTHFAEGDVGLAKITPCFENGKSAAFRNLTGGIGSGTTELHIVRPVIVGPDFVLLFLKTPHFIETGISKMTGTAGQKRVPTEYFAYSPFPLPPLAEQHRIIAKVNELMALCDQLEAARAEREATRDRLVAASLARLNTPDPVTFQDDARFALNILPALTTRPDQIKQLRQTILNLAVRGKLVPQDMRDKAANLDIGVCEDPPTEIPETWRYTSLANLLSEDTRNGYSRRPDEASDGIPILRISAGTIRNDGVVAEEEYKLISGIDRKTRDQYALKPGDLLACRFNGNKASVGRLTIFKDYLGLQPIYPDKLIRVRAARDIVIPKFLQMTGDSDIVRSEVEACCATTVGNWGISASNLKEIRFPLPPLAEQHRIVAKVDTLMALCDELEATLSDVMDKRRLLLNSLIDEALSPTTSFLNAAE